MVVQEGRRGKDGDRRLSRMRCSQTVAAQGLRKGSKKALPARWRFFSAIGQAGGDFLGFLDHNRACAGITCDV